MRTGRTTGARERKTSGRDRLELPLEQAHPTAEPRVSEPALSHSVRVALYLFAALLCLVPISTSATELRGSARVIDGDTLEVVGQTVRLLDVDAFELAQRCEGPKELAACGQLAAAALQERVEGQTVICGGDSLDDYGRLLASCAVEGDDLSAWLVREGYGLAFRRYSTRLVPLEEIARAVGQGMWRTSFEPPWVYRAERWTRATAAAPDGCAIKGNINRQGERIYHSPWNDRFYERTRIDEDKGERWFCSEREAVEAGFRAPLLK